jgi:hypothetical protein
MSGTRLPRINIDFSITAPALFYLPASMQVACRAVQLGEAVCLKNPILPLSGIFAYILLL